MSRSLNQPPPLDWQTLLLEAIQQRDAPRAIVLAQRCVHRQGMSTLERLLDHADGTAGQDGEARSWLLHLLSQKVAESEASSSPPEAPPSPPEPHAIRPPFPGVESQPSQPPDAAPPADDQVDPEATAVQASAPPSAPGPVAETIASPVPLSAPDPALAAAALDQAFAPLEIAFPPLPPVDRRESPDSAPAEPAPVVLRSFTMSEVKEGSLSVASPGLGGQVEDTAEPLRGPEPVMDDPQPLLDDFEAGAAAAPVPTFHVESPKAREPVFPSSSPLPHTTAEAPAPGSNLLEAWRAWLPGAFRSRKRS